MHGDYSRGHEPDRKRGRSYRRVLLQMGRPVLDSDVAASVDALLGEVRAVARGLSCDAGSPDLGFLVTPGRLLSIFAEAGDDLTVLAGTPDAWLDYRHRYLERYPALRIAAAGGQAARVSLLPLQQLEAGGGGVGALWARVEQPVAIAVNGHPVNLAPQLPDVATRVEFDIDPAGLDAIEIEVPAGGEVWLFALEADDRAGTAPTFWAAPGSYHVDGLVADAAGGASFPTVAFPQAAGFAWINAQTDPPLAGLIAPQGIANGTRFVAYLELHERHITHVEDPGIREEALGSTDTTARAQLVAQAKLGTIAGDVPGNVDAAAVALRAAFGSLAPATGLLTIDVPASTPTTDPCALPDPAGYSGADNRLYRVEVHEGGGIGTLRLKWSRDNGSELFAARLDDSDNLVFDAGTPLAAGDIVEVLSHVVDLGDDALGVAAAAGFTPAVRAVGQLVQLAAVEVASSSDEVVFTLVDPDDVSVAVVLDDRYGDLDRSVLKLRRWHGILDPALLAGADPPSPGPHVLEDGITVALSAGGLYEPGAYWQYEARVRGENANGPWRPQPHGPERRFAPLALLEFESDGEPLRLLAWLDERFSHPCDLDADDIEFDGERVGMVGDTVQEALEELWERPPEIVDTSCGELIIRAENGIQSVFDTIPAGESARLCIQPGVWRLDRTVEVGGKGDLIIAGAGAATRLVGIGIDTVLRFTGCGRVRIENLTIDGGAAGNVGDGLAGSLAAIDCEGLDIERVTASCGGALSRRMSAVAVRSDRPQPGRPEVRVRDCELLAGNAQVGLLVIGASSVDIENNLVFSPEGSLPLLAAMADPVVAGSVARQAIDVVVVGPFDDEMLVGGNTLNQSPLGDGRTRIEAVIGEWSAAFSFTTALTLTSDQWVQLFEQNPIAQQGQKATPATAVEKRLRAMRHQLRAIMFNQPNTLAGVTAAVRGVLLALGTSLAQRNSFSAGGQGIVLAGSGTPIDPAFPEPKVLTADQRPAVRVHGNRVLGFVAGVHVATSGRSHSRPRGLSHHVTISDNTIHLLVPSLAGSRHGIFVGSAFHTCVHGNAVEVRRPVPSGWATVAPMDGIRLHGTFGPLIEVTANSCVGTARGVVAFAINHARATTAGWRWSVTGNAHTRNGAAVPEQINW